MEPLPVVSDFDKKCGTHQASLYSEAKSCGGHEFICGETSSTFK